MKEKIDTALVLSFANGLMFRGKFLQYNEVTTEAINNIALDLISFIAINSTIEDERERLR